MGAKKGVDPLRATYIGETSRPARARLQEHLRKAHNLAPDSFMVQHWCSNHRSDRTQPKFKFKLEISCRDALSRQVSEAVLIDEVGTLNSKAEFGMNHLCRMIVEENPWSSEEHNKMAELARKKKKQDLHEFIVDMKSCDNKIYASVGRDNAVDVNLSYRSPPKKTRVLQLA